MIDRYPLRFEDGELVDLFHVLKAIKKKHLVPGNIVNKLFTLRMDNRGSHQGDEVTGYEIRVAMPVMPDIVQFLADNYPREINTEGNFLDVAKASRAIGNKSWHIDTYRRAVKTIAILLILAALGYAGYKYGPSLLERFKQETGIGSDTENAEGTDAEANTEAADGETVGAAAIIDDATMEGREKLAVASAEASSALATANLIYSADRCIDGDPDTNWQEGVEGYGEGSSLTFQFDGKTKVRYIRIRNGSAVDEEHYFGNGRPCDIRIQADGKTWAATLQDVNAFQTIELPENCKTREITLLIDTVYAGNSWQDTAISEVEFYAP